MYKLFGGLQMLNLYDKYYEVLDWLVDDRKFKNSTWDSNKKGKYTKLLKKRLPLMNDNNGYEYKNVKAFISEKATNYKPRIQMSSGSAECEDLIRHIRNGIAHNHAVVRIYDSEYYIRIVDYSDKEAKRQSAFIFAPISYLSVVFDTYKQVSKM